MPREMLFRGVFQRPVSQEVKLNGHTRRIKWSHIVGLVGVILVSGCASIGPGTLPRDRIDYSSALADSWQRQMMLNIIKLRYGEMPMFLDVSSIINQYTLQGGASALAQSGGDSDSLGAAGSYSDRPTVTYTPLTGQKFTTSLLTPISPVALLALVQAGWPVDFVFRICVQRINGITNQSAGFMRTAADPRFAELLAAMRRLQESGAISLSIGGGDREQLGDKDNSAFFVLGQVPPERREDVDLVRKILAIEADSNRLTVRYAGIASGNSEIAVLSRSVLDIMMEMAYSVQIPDQDLTAGRAGKSIYDQQVESTLPRLIKIVGSEDRPDEARSAVRYRDHWFWIDDRDMGSKYSMAFLLTLFSLSEGASTGSGPIVTIN
jgi:hypothetical protein